MAKLSCLLLRCEVLLRDVEAVDTPSHRLGIRRRSGNSHALIPRLCRRRRSKLATKSPRSNRLRRLDSQRPLKSLLIPPQRLSTRSRNRLRIRISPSPSTPTISLLPLTPTCSPLGHIRSPEIESRDIKRPRIPPHILGKRIPMLLHNMRLQLELAPKSISLLLNTLTIITHKVVLLEMHLQRIIIRKVHRLSPRLRIQLIADMAALVLLPAMDIKLIVTIESLIAERAQGMPFEARLVDCAGVVVAFAHVSRQFRIRKEVVLMREDFLVSGTEIADLLVMNRTHMAMQVRPA